MSMSTNSSDVTRLTEPHSFSSGSALPDSGESCAEADEHAAEAMTDEAYVYELSVMLMRLDGNHGDPHQLLWCGGTIPEPWGDAWQRYEDQARKLLDVLGENMAWALLHEWPPKDSPPSGE
jgi:hypothetical protein